jgi:Family of unknown function (DUF6599)
VPSKISFIRVLVIATLLVVSAALHPNVRASEEKPSEVAAKLLVERFGNFKARGPASRVEPGDPTSVSEFAEAVSASRSYVAPTGESATATIFVAPSQSAAYAMLTEARNALTRAGLAPTGGGFGTASYVLPDHVLFVQGKNYVVIKSAKQAKTNLLDELARAFSDKLEKGELEIPVLIKHLPDWDNSPRPVTYFVSSEALRRFTSAPVFEGVSFEGGTEAVSADYGSAQLVIVEFTTPQHATDGDKAVLAQIEKLRTQNRPVPTSYRRVGNYGVFVFNAADEQTAKQLIDGVKYEQVTKWLGDNPYPLLELQRRYTATTLGVLVSVVQASGLALVTCLTVGFLLGGLLFLRRRSQQRTFATYSDAGGMLRLNLDEMTPQTDPARLIGPTN